MHTLRKKEKKSPLDYFHAYARQTRRLMARDIWEIDYLGRKTVRARLYQLLRILTLTWQGLRRNKIPVQAAALTFYSLIGIGPLIALGIMISGFALEKGSEDIVMEKIYSAIAYAAPQIALEAEGNNEMEEQMLGLIQQFSEAASSGTVGAVGLIMLFVIGLQVLSSIEASFNTLWGVSQGRKLGERIVSYWTFISLGAVLGTLSVTLLTLNAIVSRMETLPMGEALAALFLFFSPILSFLMLVSLLAVFFRFIPNTQVHWGPAFCGSTIVVLLLQLYNKLSFLYVDRVVQTNSLYGSVGIIVVLMLGLFIFWLLILLGGQVTYAVQNANFLTNENAWQKTSERAREIISLSILLLATRRFQSGDPPIRSSELLKQLRVPSHIMNSSISRLCELGYLVPIEGSTQEDERDRAYQPGKPAESISLGSFKQSIESYGNNEGLDLVASLDPAIQSYLDEILSLKDCPAAERTLSDL
ncbi:MAG: YihY/virulence factor BrkB family protein, partial [Opitutales bacterium]